MSVQASDSELALALAVSRRYYLDDQSKVDIGRSLGISRFKVARLLTLARSSGLVQIDVREPQRGHDEVADILCSRYGLRECFVVRGVSDAGIGPAIGDLTASVLERVTTPTDVLGLPWSRTVHHAVKSLRHLPPVPVVQLTGALITAGQSTSFDLVRDAMAVTKGDGYLFQAPLIMPTAEGADAVRQQEDVVRAMDAANEVTVTVCSVGAWTRGGSTVFDRLPREDQIIAREAGVVGEVMGVLVDEAGQPCSAEVGRRLITIRFDQLRAIRTVIAVSQGLVRLAATRAILHSGAVDHLIVDGTLADALVSG
jgi:DNA-binding transcriptional regulator LsrR (DeoR family)